MSEEMMIKNNTTNNFADKCYKVISKQFIRS